MSKGLTLVNDGGEALTPAELIMRDEIMHVIENVAFHTDDAGRLGQTGISVIPGSFNPNVLGGVYSRGNVGEKSEKELDELAAEVIALLESASASAMKNESVETEGDLIVSFVKYNGLWRLNVRWKNGYPFSWEGERIFVFNSKTFTEGNPYKGKFHEDIYAMFVEQHGPESQEAMDVRRIIEICRGVLYGKLSEDEERSILDELRRLRLRYGDACTAIISDFDGDHVDNGWDDISEAEVEDLG